MMNGHLRRLILMVAAFAIAVAACGGDEASSGDPALVLGQAAPSPLEAELTAVLESTDVPSVGAAVFSATGELDLAAVGTRKRGEATAVTAADRYHLGSNTKAMTATVLARLADQGGGLAFDTTLPEAFPDIVDMHPDYTDVTLADLLAHVGGTPSEVPDLDAEFLAQPITTQRALGAELVLSQPAEIEPHTLSMYSNTGYVIVAAAMEVATGRSWEDLMEQELFTPLGMESCGFGAPGSADTVDEPFGHDGNGEPFFGDQPAVIGPAGSVHCSMSDWGLFLSELLNAWDNGSDYLSGATVARLLQPVDGVPVDGFEGARASLGWYVVEGSDGPVYMHDGSNTMWFSQAVVVPGINRAVIAVSNEESTGMPAVQAALQVLSEMYPG